MDGPAKNQNSPEATRFEKDSKCSVLFGVENLNVMLTNQWHYSAI